MQTEHVDVLIIGAGPAGSVAAALLRQQGHQVLMIEKQEFPRFSVGESLLPQSMQVLEDAGLLRDVIEAGFQHRNGVVFARCDEQAVFDFRDKTVDGWSTAFQVTRDCFDDLLADAAERAGAELRFCHEVVAVDVSGHTPRAMVRDPDGESYAVEARFMLDASGWARVLPRLLGLESPSGQAARGALFAHVHDGIDCRSPDTSAPTSWPTSTRLPPARFDRHKTLVTMHPVHPDAWYWIVPFADGRSSVGVVAGDHVLDAHEGNALQRLKRLVDEVPSLAALLSNARFDGAARHIAAAPPMRAQALSGRGYAVLGNAGALPDPVFGGGIAVALQSARLAARCVGLQLAGEPVAWAEAYAAPLQAGIDVFQAHVDAWYAGSLQATIFQPRAALQARRMMASVLAGYAWDEDHAGAWRARRRLRGGASASVSDPMAPPERAVTWPSFERN